MPILNSLFSRFLKGNRLTINISNLFVFQSINYVLPLITIPYILRVVGPEKFGILSLIEVINQYFVQVTDYGFNITGNQKIAIARDDVIQRNLIFSSIFTTKFFLMLICMIFGLLIFLTIGTLREHIYIFLLYFLMVPANICLSYWFFLGMEEMKYLNYPNLVGKAGYTLFIFLFLKKEDDFHLVPLFLGLSLLTAGFLSLLIIWKKFRVRYSLPSFTEVKFYLSDSWSIFLSIFSINLYRRSNILILGLFASKEAVGFYSAGEKIVKVLQSIFEPVTQAFYPYISRKKITSSDETIQSIKTLSRWLLLLTSLLTLFLFVLAEPAIALILGDQFLPAVPVLKIACFVIPFGILNYIIGIIFMTNYDMKNQFSRSVIITGIFNVIFCSVFSYYFQDIGAAIVFLLSEMVLMALLLFNVNKNKDKWGSAIA